MQRKLSSRDDEAQLREVDILRCLANDRNDLETDDSSSAQLSRQREQPSRSKQQRDNGIINLIDFYSTPTTHHIVMELARGGDVFDRLAKRKVYTEKHAHDLAERMLEAIRFLHNRGIAHRDIKPEVNVLRVSARARERRAPLNLPPAFSNRPTLLRISSSWTNATTPSSSSPILDSRDASPSIARTIP